MQIGSDNKHLPGCAPTQGEAAAPVAPVAPVVPVNKDEASPRSRKGWLLIAVLLLAVIVGALLMPVRGAKGARPDLFSQLAAFLPGSRPPVVIVKTNAVTAARAKPAQPHAAVGSSAAGPLNETKGGKELLLARETKSNGASNAVTEVVTAASGLVTNPPANVTPPKPEAAAAAGRPSDRKTDSWPALHVTAAIGGTNKFFARINGQLVVVGDTVAGATVRVITQNNVTMEWHGEQRNFHVGSRR